MKIGLSRPTALLRSISSHFFLSSSLPDLSGVGGGRGGGDGFMKQRVALHLPPSHQFPDYYDFFLLKKETETNSHISIWYLLLGVAITHEQRRILTSCSD